TIRRPHNPAHRSERWGASPRPRRTPWSGCSTVQADRPESRPRARGPRTTSLHPAKISALFLQLGDRGAGASLILRRRVEFFHMRAGFQQLPDCLAQNSHAMSVHDADAAGRRHHGRVEEFFYAVAGFVGVLADNVDLLKRRP